MKITFPITVHSFVKIGNDTFAGRYNTPSECPIKAHYIFSRTNAGPGMLCGTKGIISIGQLILHAVVQHGICPVQKYVIVYDYELLTLDPTTPFTAAYLKGQVVSARLNGKVVDVNLDIILGDGGRHNLVKISS